MGQDGGSDKDDLSDGAIEIFLREGWTGFCNRKVIFPSGYFAATVARRFRLRRRRHTKRAYGVTAIQPELRRT
jgi:hypothetical protein